MHHLTTLLNSEFIIIFRSTNHVLAETGLNWHPDGTKCLRYGHQVKKHIYDNNRIHYRAEGTRSGLMDKHFGQHEGILLDADKQVGLETEDIMYHIHVSPPQKYDEKSLKIWQS